MFTAGRAQLFSDRDNLGVVIEAKRRGSREQAGGILEARFAYRCARIGQEATQLHLGQLCFQEGQSCVVRVGQRDASQRGVGVVDSRLEQRGFGQAQRLQQHRVELRRGDCVVRVGLERFDVQLDRVAAERVEDLAGVSREPRFLEHRRDVRRGGGFGWCAEVEAGFGDRDPAVHVVRGGRCLFGTPGEPEYAGDGRDDRDRANADDPGVAQYRAAAGSRRRHGRFCCALRSGFLSSRQLAADRVDQSRDGFREATIVLERRRQAILDGRPERWVLFRRRGSRLFRRRDRLCGRGRFASVGDLAFRRGRRFRRRFGRSGRLCCRWCWRRLCGRLRSRGRLRSCRRRSAADLECGIRRFEVMLDRRLDGQSRPTGRDRLQQEAIDLAAIDQVHQHFAVVAAARDDRHEPGRALAEMQGQLLDLFADHGRVNDGDAGLLLADDFFGLRQRVRVMHRVCTTRGFLDGGEELLVLGQDENVDRLRADRGRRADFFRVQRRHAPGAVADDRGAVFRGLHDDMFAGRNIEIGGGIVGRLGEGHEAHLPRGVVDELLQCIARDVAAHDLEHLFVADERFDALVVISGKQDTDGVRRPFLRFAQGFEAAHAGEFLRGNHDVDRCCDERVQCFGTGCGAMHGVTVAEARTEQVQRALLAVQQQYLCLELVKRHFASSRDLCLIACPVLSSIGVYPRVFAH